MITIDMGCGNHKKGNVGLDIKAESEADIIGDAQNTPFRDKVFTNAYCFEVLEHIPIPLKVLKELRRITRGMILISIPNILNFSSMWRWIREGRLSGSPEHIYAWTPREFNNLMRQAGINEYSFSFTTWSHYHQPSVFRCLIPRIFNKSLVIKANLGT